MRTKKYFPRDLMEDLKKWIDRREIYVIKGARQAGKTTILKMLRQYLIKEKQVKPGNIIFLTFKDRDILEQFSSDPKVFIRSHINTKNTERFYFFLDEIHYLPDAGRKLKLVYDFFENVKFIITGSSSLELTGKTSQFLSGRMFSFFLPQFSFAEFIRVKSKELESIYRERAKKIKDFIISDKDFNLKKDTFASDFQKLYEEYAVYGGYPEVINSEDFKTKRTILKNIYEAYLSGDIIKFLRVKDTQEFRTIVNFVASTIGGFIEYSSLCNESKTHFKKIKLYLSVLEETYIISLLKPFYNNKTAELRKNQKVYFLDTGLRNSAIKNFNIIRFRPDAPELIKNTAFIQLRINYPDIPLKYWQTLGKAEVDFVLHKEKKAVPIDVSYVNMAEPKITRGFRNFLHSYKPTTALVLTRGFCGQLKVNSSLIKFMPIWYV